jgi:oxepin-CoA hydrolase/3-oxo-5,6-dehydrosuberyl-CoA semialdehyde dehydrogenase
MAFENFTELLVNLDPETKPLWGKMTVQHMVEHLILTFQMSNGNLVFDKSFNPPEKYAALKRFLMSKKPLPKNFINPAIGEDLKPLKFKNLKNAGEALNNEIDIFIKYFDRNPDITTVNVTFGPLNKNEWMKFHEKHLTHHLKQFGLILDESL